MLFLNGETTLFLIMDLRVAVRPGLYGVLYGQSRGLTACSSESFRLLV